MIDYVDMLGPLAKEKVDPDKVREVLDRLKEVALQRDIPLMATCARPGPHADVVLAIERASEGLQPGNLTMIVGKTRAPRRGFPVQFPDMESYAKGFGSDVSPAWLRAHVPEYAGVTFRTHALSDNPLWDKVDVYGPIAPGTMLVQHPHRDDVRPGSGRSWEPVPRTTSAT